MRALIARQEPLGETSLVLVLEDRSQGQTIVTREYPEGCTGRLLLQRTAPRGVSSVYWALAGPFEDLTFLLEHLLKYLEAAELPPALTSREEDLLNALAFQEASLPQELPEDKDELLLTLAEVFQKRSLKTPTLPKSPDPLLPVLSLVHPAFWGRSPLGALTRQCHGSSGPRTMKVAPWDHREGEEDALIALALGLTEHASSREVLESLLAQSASVARPSLLRMHPDPASAPREVLLALLGIPLLSSPLDAWTLETVVQGYHSTQELTRKFLALSRELELQGRATPQALRLLALVFLTQPEVCIHLGPLLERLIAHPEEGVCLSSAMEYLLRDDGSLDSNFSCAVVNSFVKVPKGTAATAWFPALPFMHALTSTLGARGILELLRDLKTSASAGFPPETYAKYLAHPEVHGLPVSLWIPLVAS